MKMTVTVPSTAVLLMIGLLLAACASAPDHFYALHAIPETARRDAAPSALVHLQVTLPSMVDRAEMVLNTSATGIAILDHERWAAPLPDLVLQTLSRDLETRRPDILVVDRSFARTVKPAVDIKVDIVRMIAQAGGKAGIDARWHITTAGNGSDRVGQAWLEAPAAGSDHSSIAAAYSEALSELAARLAEQMQP